MTDDVTRRQSRTDEDTSGAVDSRRGTPSTFDELEYSHEEALEISRSMDLSMEFWGCVRDVSGMIPANRLKIYLEKPSRASESAQTIWSRMNQADLDHIVKVERTLMLYGEISVDQLFETLEKLAASIGIHFQQLFPETFNEDIISSAVNVMNELLYIYNQNEPPEIESDDDTSREEVIPSYSKYPSSVYVTLGNANEYPKITVTEEAGREIGEKMEQLMEKAKKHGLTDIKIPSSTMLTDEAKLELVKKQIKAKLRLQKVNNVINSNNEQWDEHGKEKKSIHSLRREINKKIREDKSNIKPTFRVAVKPRELEFNSVVRNAPNLQTQMKRTKKSLLETQIKLNNYVAENVKRITKTNDTKCYKTNFDRNISPLNSLVIEKSKVASRLASKSQEPIPVETNRTFPEPQEISRGIGRRYSYRTLSPTSGKEVLINNMEWEMSKHKESVNQQKMLNDKNSKNVKTLVIQTMNEEKLLEIIENNEESKKVVTQISNQNSNYPIKINRYIIDNIQNKSRDGKTEINTRNLTSTEIVHVNATQNIGDKIRTREAQEQTSSLMLTAFSQTSTSVMDINVNVRKDDRADAFLDKTEDEMKVDIQREEDLLDIVVTQETVNPLLWPRPNEPDKTVTTEISVSQFKQGPAVKLSVVNKVKSRETGLCKLAKEHPEKVKEAVTYLNELLDMNAEEKPEICFHEEADEEEGQSISNDGSNLEEQELINSVFSEVEKLTIRKSYNEDEEKRKNLDVLSDEKETVSDISEDNSLEGRSSTRTNPVSNMFRFSEEDVPTMNVSFVLEDQPTLAGLLHSGDPRACRLYQMMMGREPPIFLEEIGDVRSTFHMDLGSWSQQIWKDIRRNRNLPSDSMDSLYVNVGDRNISIDDLNETEIGNTNSQSCNDTQLTSLTNDVFFESAGESSQPSAEGSRTELDKESSTPYLTEDSTTKRSNEKPINKFINKSKSPTRFCKPKKLSKFSGEHGGSKSLPQSPTKRTSSVNFNSGNRFKVTSNSEEASSISKDLRPMTPRRSSMTTTIAVLVMGLYIITTYPVLAPYGYIKSILSNVFRKKESEGNAEKEEEASSSK